jgi:hypothetical protein
VCQQCTAQYAPDLENCPQCGAVEAHPQEQVQAGPLLPVVVVACRTPACGARGVPRRVVLRQATPGVLERPSLVCARCLGELEQVTNEQEQEEESMAKVTVHTGPSNADDPQQQPGDGGQYPERAGEQTDGAPDDAAENDGGQDDGQDDGSQDVPAEDYSDWTVAQLRGRLAIRGLPTGGNKTELLDRLTKSDRENQPASTED